MEVWKIRGREGKTNGDCESGRMVGVSEGCKEMKLGDAVRMVVLVLIFCCSVACGQAIRFSRGIPLKSSLHTILRM